jgi:hypothetical protein
MSGITPNRTLYVIRQGPPSLEAALLSGLLAAPDAPAHASVCLLRPVAPWPALAGAQVVAVPAPEGRRWSPSGRVVRTVADLAKAVNATLVHSLGAEAQVVGGRAAKLAGIPSLWSQLGVARWGDLVHVSAAMAPGGAVLTYAAASQGAQRKLPGGRRTRLLSPGVPVASDARAARRRRARAALALPADAMIVALAGPVCRPDEPLATFLHAGASLCHARTDALLLLPTPKHGSEKAVLAAIALHAGPLRALDRIHTLPVELEERFLYDAADIVSYDAHPRALPLGLIMTMAAGAAAVACDRPMVREFADDRVDAVYFVPGDAEGLALVLLALADDPDQRETLALTGEARARERYDAMSMAAKVAELEAELLRK